MKNYGNHGFFRDRVSQLCKYISHIFYKRHIDFAFVFVGCYILWTCFIFDFLPMQYGISRKWFAILVLFGLFSSLVSETLALSLQESVNLYVSNLEKNVASYTPVQKKAYYDRTIQQLEERVALYRQVQEALRQKTKTINATMTG